MTIGDVLAAIAAAVGIAGAWIATLLMVSLVAPDKTASAQQRSVANPRACALRGLGVLILFGLLALSLGEHPAGPVKLLSACIWGMLGMIAALGSAGIVTHIAERLTLTDTRLDGFAGRTRAALLYVASGILPIIGWFFIAPVALLISLGAGVSAILERKPKTQPAEMTVYSAVISEPLS